MDNFKKFQATILCWFIYCLSWFGVAVCYHYGIQDKILDADPTFLTFFITGACLVAQTILCWQVFNFEKISTWKRKVLRLENFWFKADSAVNFGMIGTVIGFIISLEAFKIVLSHATNIQDTVPILVIGMSTALWATLAGLVCSQIMKIQLRIVEHFHEVEE